MKTWQRVSVVAGFAALSAVAVLGNFHVIQSSDGTTLVRKPHFTFSETFVSIHAITGQPLITARQSYPLAVKSLQDAGILETEEQVKARVTADLEFNARKEQRELDTAIERDLLVDGLDDRHGMRGTWWIVGTLTNNGADPYDLVQVQFDILNHDGATVDNVSAIKETPIMPGEVWQFQVQVFDNPNARYRFAGVDATPR